MISELTVTMKEAIPNSLLFGIHSIVMFLTKSFPEHYLFMQTVFF